MNENIYYCYSKKQSMFIQSFGVKPSGKGVNANSKCPYTCFEKSERLDKIIGLYNEVKHKY